LAAALPRTTEVKAKGEATSASKLQPQKPDTTRLVSTVPPSSAHASAPRRAGADPLDEAIPGVPRAISSKSKTIVALVAALAVLLAVVGGLSALRARQQQLSDEARARAATTGPEATARRIGIPPPRPIDVEPSPTESALATQPAAPPTSSSMVASSAPAEVASRAMPASAPPQMRRTPTPQESLAEPKPEHTGGSLVAQASHALERGATARAIDLARQAVSSNPSDADAWLTLGAAYQASGNAGEAREAYANCVAHARTANVSECRLYAAPR
jgi:tetratricopeptide (TPR) repeat protein